MGLISFIKNAGAKLFNRNKKEEVQETAAPVELTKIQALEQQVRQLNLPIQNMSIDLAEQVIVTGTTETNEQREKVILALGNVDGVACIDDRISVTNPEPEATFHEVKSGDTLSKIAKEVYGDPMKYPTIFEANKPMLSDPDKIYPGQILRIPAL